MHIIVSSSDAPFEMGSEMLGLSLDALQSPYMRPRAVPDRGRQCILTGDILERVGL